MQSSMCYAGIHFPFHTKLSLLTHFAYHRSHHSPSRKRKRRKQPSSIDEHRVFIDPPPLASSITIGFNPTTEHLENEIQGKPCKHLKAIFVARGDTSSTQLYAHFPLMTSMLPHVRLVSLAKGAEARLCETLQLKRVGVIGLMVSPLRTHVIVGRCARGGDVISSC